MTVEHSLTPSEIAAVADLHMRAFPDFFLSSLGRSFLEQFYAGFIDDPTAIVAVIRDRGAPTAIAVGTTEPAGFFRRLLVRRWPGFIHACLRACVRNPLAMPRLLAGALYRGGRDRPSSAALLSSICVSPEARGRGVGVTVLNGWVSRASELGAKSAYLTTDADDNGAVNAFYSRHGWRLEGSTTDRRGRIMNMYQRDLPLATGSATSELN